MEFAFLKLQGSIHLQGHSKLIFYFFENVYKPNYSGKWEHWKF